MNVPYDVCYALNSGAKEDIARGPRWAKSGSAGHVLSAASPNRSPLAYPDGHVRRNHPLALSQSFVFAPAAGKRRRFLQGNARDKRIGVTMDQPPFRIVLAIDLRNPK